MWDECGCLQCMLSILLMSSATHGTFYVHITYCCRWLAIVASICGTLAEVFPANAFCIVFVEVVKKLLTCSKVL